MGPRRRARQCGVARLHPHRDAGSGYRLRRHEPVAVRRVPGGHVPEDERNDLLAVEGDDPVDRAGEPHAEIEALRDAKGKGNKASGATLYVTLEPCCTTGRTPPCTEAIIASGIKRVVVGATDPNLNHSGKAFSILRRAGIDWNLAPVVDVGIAHLLQRQETDSERLTRTGARPRSRICAEASRTSSVARSSSAAIRRRNCRRTWP